MFSKDVFTAKEICRMLEIYPKTLAYWVKKGALVPGVYAPSGRGTVRLFNTYNVFQAAIIRELAKDEFSLSFIGQVLGFFDQIRFIEKFWNRFSQESKLDSQIYLIWAGDYTGQPNFMDLFEISRGESYQKLRFEEFERVIVFNLNLLCDRIADQFDELGVKL